MIEFKPYTVVFFGLSGLGSQMLQYLIDLKLTVRKVYTRRETIEHPYFPIRSVAAIADQYCIPCSQELTALPADSPDLIICSTYHKIIPAEILAEPRLGSFNFHPSLLPAYQGATPTKQCILNGEQSTGITVHKMSTEVDAGDIVALRKIKIEEFFDDGLLRQHLAGLQYHLLLDLFQYLSKENGRSIKINSIKSSYYPAFQPLEINYQPDMSIRELSRKVRASSPYPGLSLHYGSRHFRINKQVSYSPGAYQPSFSAEQKTITITGQDGILIVVNQEA